MAKTIRKVQVWIFDSKGRVLLLKLNRKRGGFWQPVTGGVERGESSPRAALREAQEETGLELYSRPRPTGYRFSFEGRWGPAREIVYALSVKPRALTQPRLDPREHVDSRWVSPAQAMKALKFDSNRKGLKAALKVWRSGMLLFLLCAGAYAEAAQRAKVGSEPVQTYRLPSRQSEYLDVLPAGAEIWVADQPFADEQRAFWFKVRLPSGQTGYVEARELTLPTLKAESQRAGFADEIVDSDPRQEREWGVHFRLGALGGAMVFPEAGAALGGDAEFSLNLLLNHSGYLRRLLALAVSFTALPWQTSQMIVAGGPVFRIFSETLMEPEVRVRAGYNFSSENFAISPSFGYRLQLGTNPSVHFTWFWDLGCWLEPGVAGGDPRVTPYLLSGFGLSF